MDEFYRSLVAAALTDEQVFSLPGCGTLSGHYVSARVDHGARLVRPPRLEVAWRSEVDPEVPTFAEMLARSGATSAEAAAAERSWCDALRDGRPIEIADLGTLASDPVTGLIGFAPDEEALGRAYWAGGAVAVEPLRQRAGADAVPVAPVVPIATGDAQRADADAQPAVTPSNLSTRAVPAARRPRPRRWFGVAVAASVPLLAALAVWTFATRGEGGDPIADDTPQVVAVNQDRLNRSPSDDLDADADADADALAAGDPDAGDAYAVAPDEFDAVIPDAGLDEYAGYDEDDDAAALLAADPAYDDLAVEDLEALGALDFSAGSVEAVIILGSFSDAANAARMTERVAATGLVPYVDQPGDLTRVGVSFEAQSVAEIAARMRELRAAYTPDAWFLR